MIKRRRSLLIAIAVSLAVHACILFVVRWKPVPPPMRTIEVELSEPTVAPVKASARSPHRAHETSSVQPRANQGLALHLALNLAPSFVPLNAGGDISVRPALAPGELPPDDPTSAWGSGGGDFARVADLGRFDRFYDVIDSHVVYPGVLAYHGVEGTVNARLIVTPTGACDWHQTTISSTQSNLRVYVLDVLKRVCARDLSRFARSSSNSNFDLSFKFAITEHDDKALIAAEKKIVGNVFLFYRNSQQSVAEWHLGPFRGMFPIPTVALDFAWLQENYEKVLYSRDPLREFKEHLSQETPNG